MASRATVDAVGREGRGGAGSTAPPRLRPGRCEGSVVLVRRVCSADSSHLGPAPGRARRGGRGRPTRIPAEEGPPGTGKGVLGARIRATASEFRPVLTGASGPRSPRRPSPLQTGVQGSRMACSGRPGGWSCRRDLVLSASPSQACSGGQDVCRLQEGNASEGEGGSLRFGAFPRGSGYRDSVQLENSEFISILHT